MHDFDNILIKDLTKDTIAGIVFLSEHVERSTYVINTSTVCACLFFSPSSQR